MNIDNILKEFVKESVNELNLKSIIQFGSSTYSKNFYDIDLMFVFKDEVIKTSDVLKLRELIKKFEGRYKDIVFDFGGVGTRKKKAEYAITVVLFNFQDLNVKYNPNDLFLLKSLKIDKNVKILYGENLFKRLDINLTNRHLFEELSVDLKHALRKSLDDEIDKESIYRLFKIFLRAMLINKGNYEKEKLLGKFKGEFSGIKLPKNSEKIILKKIKNEDFEDVINFAEDCLKYLIK